MEHLLLETSHGAQQLLMAREILLRIVERGHMGFVEYRAAKFNRASVIIYNFLNIFNITLKYLVWLGIYYFLFTNHYILGVYCGRTNHGEKVYRDSCSACVDDVEYFVDYHSNEGCNGDCMWDDISSECISKGN